MPISFSSHRKKNHFIEFHFSSNHSHSHFLFLSRPYLISFLERFFWAPFFLLNCQMSSHFHLSSFPSSFLFFFLFFSFYFLSFFFFFVFVFFFFLYFSRVLPTFPPTLTKFCIYFFCKIQVFFLSLYFSRAFCVQKFSLFFFSESFWRVSFMFVCMFCFECFFTKT